MRTLVISFIMVLTLSVGLVFGGQADLERELRGLFMQSRELVAAMLADGACSPIGT
ncbi:MAG: hypothetical protein RQ724_03190 [Desulfuromonadales bacterium]|nr:hypothetical protein [Desulfuromonadales bacterium]